MNIKNLTILLLLIIIFPRTYLCQNDSSKNQQKPDFHLLIGPQLNEGVNSKTSIMIGLSIDLYEEKEFSFPLEFLIHTLKSENFSNYQFFPRISANIKHDLVNIGLTELYIQGGIGVPVLFPYLFDFSPALGLSYKTLQIDIRNTFYFDSGVNNNFGVNRWPMTAIILGLGL